MSTLYSDIQGQTYADFTHEISNFKNLHENLQIRLLLQLSSISFDVIQSLVVANRSDMPQYKWRLKTYLANRKQL